MTTTALVHEARLCLAEGVDAQRPGAVVTTELCGHWEHEGPCRWPHHTSASVEGSTIVVRTVFAVGVERGSNVASTVAAALGCDDGWVLKQTAVVDPTPGEQQIGERLARSTL